MDTCPCLLPRVPYTTYYVYLTPRVHVFPPLVHGSISRDYTRPHRATSLYTRLWSSHTKRLYEGASFSPDRLQNRPEAARYLFTLVTACTDRDTHTLSKFS
jgi:hypothetical protein